MDQRNNSVLSAIKNAMAEWKHDNEDCAMAIRAAEAMSQRLYSDVCIMGDLRVLPVHQAIIEERKGATILETIRYA